MPFRPLVHFDTLTLTSCCDWIYRWSNSVAAIAVEVVIVVLAKVAVAVVLVVACTYYLFVNWSSPLRIFWKFQLNTQINSWDTPFWKYACTKCVLIRFKFPVDILSNFYLNTHSLNCIGIIVVVVVVGTVLEVTVLC